MNRGVVVVALEYRVCGRVVNDLLHLLRYVEVCRAVHDRIDAVCEPAEYAEIQGVVELAPLGHVKLVHAVQCR